MLFKTRSDKILANSYFFIPIVEQIREDLIEDPHTWNMANYGFVFKKFYTSLDSLKIQESGRLPVDRVLSCYKVKLTHSQIMKLRVSRTSPDCFLGCIKIDFHSVENLIQFRDGREVEYENPYCENLELEFEEETTCLAI